MKYLKILLSVLLVLSSYSIAQISSKKVDKLIKEAMETFNVPGVAVGIVKDGKIIHSKGYGIKSIEAKGPVNENTIFSIASNTKAFTTAALSILVDKGKLSWDDKVVDIIPEFKMYNEYVTQNFNIVDLITHRSGLGLGAGDLMFIPDGTDFTMMDILTCYQHFEPKSAFRTEYAYDNLLYEVAGEVINRVSKVSWEEFIAKNILEPLKMDNSYSSVNEIIDTTNLAIPHSNAMGNVKTIPFFDLSNLNAAGGIYSTADDMCNWLLLHLNRGKYGKNLTNEVYSEDRQKDMWKIYTVFNVGPSTRYNSHFSGYGMGWGLIDKLGNLQVGHTGGLPGMFSLMLMIPDLELGIVILTNADNGGSVYGTVYKTIIDSYLKLDNYDWLDYYVKRFDKYQSEGDSVTTKVWATVEAAKGVKINTDDYIGVYEDSWFGKVEIFKNGDLLWFKALRSPKLNGQMFYYKANAFAIKWEYQDFNADAFAIFSLDEEGKAQNIKMKGISPNIDFSFDFQDLHLIRIEE